MIFDVTDLYYLEVKLQYDVEDEKANAKFDRKRKELKIILPIVQVAEVVFEVDPNLPIEADEPVVKYKKVDKYQEEYYVETSEKKKEEEKEQEKIKEKEEAKEENLNNQTLEDSNKNISDQNEITTNKEEKENKENIITKDVSSNNQLEIETKLQNSGHLTEIKDTQFSHKNSQKHTLSCLSLKSPLLYQLF